MPKVGGKKFPYTKEGKKDAAAAAMDKDKGMMGMMKKGGKKK